MSKPKRFVVELTLTVSDDGSTQTFRVSSDGFTTTPSDTPANTYIPGNLVNPGSVERNLFTGPRVSGPITPNYGNIVIANPETDTGYGSYDSWGDYGASGGTVICYWGDKDAVYPDGYTTVYVAYIHTLQANTKEITLILRDQLQLLDKPVISEGFAGTGKLEGTGGISKLKQRVFGEPGFYPPILVDYERQIYAVHFNGAFEALVNYSTERVANLYDVYENGVRIDRDFSYYTSEDDLWRHEPDPGTVKYYMGAIALTGTTWYMTGPVFFRLGTPPVGELRVYGSGIPTVAESALLNVPLAGNYTSSLLAAMAGVSLANIDTSRSIAFHSQLVDSDMTYLEVLTEQAKIDHSWFGFNRLGIFRAGKLLDPDSSDAYYGITPGVTPGDHNTPSVSVYTFKWPDLHNFQRRQINGMEAPVHRVVASFGDTWPCPVNEAAPKEMKDYLTREPKWWTATGASSSTILANPGAISTTVESRVRGFLNNFGVRVWMERFFVLFGGRRYFYSFSCSMTPELLALDLHDVVTLESPRFGLSAGKKFRIVGITINCGSGVPTIDFLLWGGEAGRYTGTTNTDIPSGGNPGTPASQTERNQNLIGEFTQVFYGTVDVSTPAGDTTGLSIESIGEFTQIFIAELLYDEYIDDVVLLVQGGSNGSTTIQDQSPTYGDTATITAGATFSSGQSIFGHNMIAGTQIMPDVSAFTSSGADSRFSRPSGEETTVEFWCRWNSLPGTDPSGALFTWTGPSGNLLRLSWYSSAGQLGLINGSTNVGPITTLSADANHFIQARMDSSNILTIYADGAQIYSDACSSANGAGTYSVHIAGVGSANATSATYWMGPCRMTKGVARPFVVPSTEFALS